MLKNIKKIQVFINFFFKKVIPQSTRTRTDAEAFGILKFIEFASKEIKKIDRVLDAGAGFCPYKKIFLMRNTNLLI